VEPVVSVQALLLKTQLPDVTLREGTSVVARVLSRGENHGVLVIAGIPLTATLPVEIGKTGETLRLSISDVTPDRVTLKLDEVVNPAAQPPPPPADRPRVTVQDPPSRTSVGGEERARVALSFQSPALGRLDLRIEVASGRVMVGVEASAGRPFDLADAASGRLHDGLQARTGLDPAVQVTPRREPLDLYA
jgi:hypothetical protein